MYDAVASTSWFASIYFVSLVIIGNYVVLTLFLAILIDHFQNNDVRCGVGTRSPTVVATLSHRCSAGLVVDMPQEPDDDEALTQPLPSDHLGLLGARPDVATLVQQQRAQHEHRTNLAKVVAQALEQEQAALDRSRQFQYHPSHAHGSLFTFGADSKFRQLCAYLVLHKYFEWVGGLCVCVCVCVCVCATAKWGAFLSLMPLLFRDAGDHGADYLQLCAAGDRLANRILPSPRHCSAA